MPGPLLAVDAPSLLYRAFYALPKTITGPDGTPVNALLGVSNLVLQAVEIHDPRAVVLCFGEEAAPYRVELYSGYHADRPEMPEELVPQWADAPAYFGAFKWTVIARADARGRRPARQPRRRSRPTPAARRCSSPATATCSSASATTSRCCGRSAAKGEPEVIGPTEVRERYGIAPEQVPDFIALRGDPSDGIPGAKGIGEKTARDLLRDHADARGPHRRRGEAEHGPAPAHPRRADRRRAGAARLPRDGDAAAGRHRAPAGPADGLAGRRGRRARARA